jgi:hypothetical protein
VHGREPRGAPTLRHPLGIRQRRATVVRAGPHMTRAPLPARAAVRSEHCRPYRVPQPSGRWRVIRPATKTCLVPRARTDCPLWDGYGECRSSEAGRRSVMRRRSRIHGGPKRVDHSTMMSDTGRHCRAIGRRSARPPTSQPFEQWPMAVEALGNDHLRANLAANAEARVSVTDAARAGLVSRISVPERSSYVLSRVLSAVLADQ